MVTDPSIELVLAGSKVLLDTSFAMEPSFRPFVFAYREQLRGKLFVPEIVLSELKGLKRNREEARREAAEVAVLLIQALEGLGELQVRGEACDQKADLVIQRVVEQHLLNYDWVVLTNDRNLTVDLYGKRVKYSVPVEHDLTVIRLDPVRQAPVVVPETVRPRNSDQPPQDVADAGAVSTSSPTDSSRPVPEETRPAPPAVVAAPLTPSPATLPTPKPFATASLLRPGLGQAIPAGERLGPGDPVYLPDGPALTLGKAIATGGEATVFGVEAPRGYVCKIYLPEKLTTGKRDKVQLMRTRQLERPAICWPEAVIQDRSGLFRGYLMRHAAGQTLAESLFLPEEFRQSRPEWTRRDSVQLAITLLEQIEYLHRLNVLIGDLNPHNLLFQEATRVSLIDCDSYQVEGYPCPVGTPTFLAPELQGVALDSVLRTREQELFAIATLIFMILMPGKPPYSHAGGSDASTNIRRRKFPYTRNLGQKVREAPPGAWTLCWSHLSFQLKNAFTQSFDASQSGEPRIEVVEWLSLLRQYADVLQDERNVFHGPQQRIGYDLSIMPQNRRYTSHQSRPVPTDGKTDYERIREWVLLRMNSLWNTPTGEGGARFATLLARRGSEETDDYPSATGADPD